MGYVKKVHACKYPGRVGWYWFRTPVVGDQWKCKCGQLWEFSLYGALDWTRWKEVK